jgi:hypothetical protein
MIQRFQSGLLAAGLVLLAVPASAQPRPRAPLPPNRLVDRPAAPQDVRPPTDETSARDTQSQLEQLFRQYPPSLRQVLQLDPSLLGSDEYLAPYPALAAFVATHPEIGHNPGFFLGRPNSDARDNGDDPRAQRIRAFDDISDPFFLLCGFIAFFATIAWLTRLLVEHRRWLRAVKTQSDVQTKLVDRLTSSEDLLAYMQTPAGRSFVESAPMPVEIGRRVPGSPIGRILSSVQAGVVLAVVGVGLFFVRNRVMDILSGPLQVVAVLAISLGVGFILSSAVAYTVSSHLGILEGPKT